MREIRAVRDRMAGRVEQEGIFAFYASLEGRAAKLMAQHRSANGVAAPHSTAARKAKRRALVDALPEPKAIQEVHHIRQEIRAGEKPPAATSIVPKSTGGARRSPASTASNMWSRRPANMSCTTGR